MILKNGNNFIEYKYIYLEYFWYRKFNFILGFFLFLVGLKGLFLFFSFGVFFDFGSFVVFGVLVWFGSLIDLGFFVYDFCEYVIDILWFYGMVNYFM